MADVQLAVVGKILGQRKPETAAPYAHIAEDQRAFALLVLPVTSSATPSRQRTPAMSFPVSERVIVENMKTPPPTRASPRKTPTCRISSGARGATIVAGSWPGGATDSGWAHCGQDTALSETCLPHSGHAVRAMMLTSSHGSSCARQPVPHASSCATVARLRAGVTRESVLTTGRRTSAHPCHDMGNTKAQIAPTIRSPHAWPWASDW